MKKLVFAMVLLFTPTMVDANYYRGIHMHIDNQLNVDVNYIVDHGNHTIPARSSIEFWNGTGEYFFTLSFIDFHGRPHTYGIGDGGSNSFLYTQDGDFDLFSNY